jgi:hypothetical protein
MEDIKKKSDKYQVFYLELISRAYELIIQKIEIPSISQIPISQIRAITEPEFYPEKSSHSRSSQLIKKHNKLMINIGVEKTIQTVCQIIHDNLTRNPFIKKVVSVGSGNGYLESILQQRLNYVKLEFEIICIDPNPSQFLKKSDVYFPPQFAYLSQYLDTIRPEEYFNCILLLNWPEVDKKKGAGYDLEAIKQLNPLHVICLFEKSRRYGGAGSEAFHEFRNEDKIYKKTVIHTKLCYSKNPLLYEWHFQERERSRYEMYRQFYIIENWTRDITSEEYIYIEQLRLIQQRRLEQQRLKQQRRFKQKQESSLDQVLKDIQNKSKRIGILQDARLPNYQNYFK